MLSYSSRSQQGQVLEFVLVKNFCTMNIFEQEGQDLGVQYYKREFIIFKRWRRIGVVITDRVKNCKPFSCPDSFWTLALWQREERVMKATTSINNLRCLGGTVWHNSGNTYLYTSFFLLTTTIPFFCFFTSIPFYPCLF